MSPSSQKAFTLIELLIVIAVIAILSVVVVLVLSPAELLRQSRDSNRVSDMATLTSALGTYSTDQSGVSSFSLGSSSVVYVSIPDPAATSTAGDQCQALGLITLPATYTYHCAASSTYRNVNGTGWIPVNFTLMSLGSPLGNLPVNTTNNSSSRLNYTYTTSGTNYEMTSAMESQKYAVGGTNDVISNDGGPLATVYEKGTKLGLEPMDYGDITLVGYWPLNEGSGTVVYDYSGNNVTGTWSGTQIGNNGYYINAAKVGSYAGDFDGISDKILMGPLTTGIRLTMSAWIKTSNVGQQSVLNNYANNNGIYWGTTSGDVFSYSSAISPPDFLGTHLVSNGVWHFITYTLDGSSGTFYIDGVLDKQISQTRFSITSAGAIGFGQSSNDYFNGLIGDVRFYNRALSAAQILAMYNGGK